MPLSQETIATIKATAPVVAENVMDITSTFYKTMFKNNPEVLAFFNISHQRNKSQPRALADSVVAYATNIDNLGALSEVVERITTRHVALSILPEHYEIVHKNLMLAIGEILGDAVTPEIAAAWSEAVSFLAEICIDAEEKLYKEKEAKIGGWRGERDFTLLEKETVAEDTIRFVFSPVDGYDGGFEYEAGQYLTIRVPDAAPRHYTLTSQPGSKTLECTVRLVKGGVVSTYMHTEINVGDQVSLGVPCGIFVPQSADRPVVLISAGVGVTTMRSFLHSMKDRIVGAYHVDKSLERHPYRQEFLDAKLPFFETSYSNEQGRCDCKDIASAVMKAAGGADADYYLCGPSGFMASMECQLRQRGASHVYFEKFGTGTIEKKKCPI